MAVINSPNGTFVDVSDENRLLGDVVIETQSHHINHRTGKVWTYSFFDINPSGANDNFLHILNTGDKAYSLTNISVWSSTLVGLVKIIKVNGTASFVSGSTLSAITRSTGKSPTPTIVVTTDTDITGINEAGILEAINLAVLDTNYPILQPADILLEQGGQIVFQWQPATGELSGTITITELP